MGSTDVISEELVIEDLDHLGIVAGVVDQIGLVECIDARLGRYEDECISAGQVLKAMILKTGLASSPPRCTSSAAFSRASPPNTCWERASSPST